MPNKLRDIFCPTKEKELEQLERFKEIIESVPDGNCSNCKYNIPPDPQLPGFVTDYGECSKNMDFFYSKVCHLNEIDCPCYEKDTTSLDNINKKIKELQNATSKTT